MAEVVVLVGPTASGKSDVAMELARRRGGVILSADSMQVYRGMDIGTAKPTQADREEIAHEMIDVADPDTDFTVAHFQMAAREALMRHVKRRVIIAGGSGLHVRAIVDPMDFPPFDPTIRSEIESLGEGRALSELRQADPDVASVLDVKNPRRVIRALEIVRSGGLTPTERVQQPQYAKIKDYIPQIPFVGFGFDPGELLEQRVRQRVDAMFEAGLVAEVDSLASALGNAAGQAVGYKEVLLHLAEGDDLKTAKAGVISATLHLVKRQRTFFRRDPRINWLAWDDDPRERAARLLSEMDRLSA